MYRIVKTRCWWCELIDTEQPQYLFWDKTLKRYRIGCRTTASRHKWEFTEKELAKIRTKYPDFDSNFEVFLES